MGKRGRPPLSDAVAAEKAAHIIKVATALRFRPSELGRLGFESEAQAMRYVRKRWRGKVGAFIGDSVRELLAGRTTATGAAVYPVPRWRRKVRVFVGDSAMGTAVYLVTEHGLSQAFAAEATGVDPRNFRRKLQAEKKRRAAWLKRRGPMAVQVTDATPE